MALCSIEFSWFDSVVFCFVPLFKKSANLSEYRVCFYFVYRGKFSVLSNGITFLGKQDSLCNLLNVGSLVRKKCFPSGVELTWPRIVIVRIRLRLQKLANVVFYLKNKNYQKYYAEIIYILNLLKRFFASW